MNLLENIKLALLSIKGNMLRAFLTLMIIAFGIMALVGILTAIDSIIYSMSSNFSSLGANSFSIERSDAEFESTQDGKVQKAAEIINYRQALEFKERYRFPSTVSVSFQCTGRATIHHKDIETNPTTQVYAVDENYLLTSGNQIAYGRFFSADEALSTMRISVIGQELADELFKNPENALGKTIGINSYKMRVVGILEKRGSSMNRNAGRSVMIPLYLGKQLYASANTEFGIQVKLPGAEFMKSGISQATGVMRSVRRLKVKEKNDFDIATNNAIIDIIKENTVKLRAGAIIIGIVTMLGAAIGLMNIMLVSVTERTREIGIIKAIGATSLNIRTQFLTEAVIISLFGGFLGIILGIFAGNGVSYLTGGNFIIPWNWILVALFLCIGTGIVSGLYPAIKAARLDPIESLRYE